MSATYVSKHATTLRLPDFNMLESVVCQGGTPAKIGKLVVTVGKCICLGHGQYDDQERATGRIKGVFKNADGETVPGTLRINKLDRNGYCKYVLFECRSEELEQGNGDVTKEKVFNRINKGVIEDEAIEIEYIADADSVVVAANSALQMAATKYLY